MGQVEEAPGRYLKRFLMQPRKQSHPQITQNLRNLWMDLFAPLRETLLREHFPEEFYCPRISRFTKRSNRLLAHELVGMRACDLDKQRH